jgi:flagellar biosynthesis/type III secretory pathway protein FliH
MASLEEMLEELWEESPRVQRERARAWAEGYAEGLAKAKAEGLGTVRSMVLTVVSVRFLALMDIAHKKVSMIMHFEELLMLTEKIIAAPDEETVRALLLPQQPS